MIVGIDPGSTGGIAWLHPDGGLARVEDMPYDDGHVVAAMLADLLTAGPTAVVWVERAQAMPRQGVSSTFKYGVGYGTILGVCGALRLPVRHVTPAVWKRAAGLSKDKGASRRRACELWPAHSASFGRVRDDGRAEAALIARHGWEVGRG